MALNLALLRTVLLIARRLTRANLSKLILCWLHLLLWPTRQQNSREGAMLTYCVSNPVAVTVSQPGTTFNPLTSNAPMSGAEVRSTEASAPLAC